MRCFEKAILMMSLRLERVAAVRWRQLLITPLPSECKGQCVQSNVMMQVLANRAAALRKLWYLRLPTSDEVTDGVVRTAMKRWIHRHPKHPDQRPLRPPKLLLTQPAISPAMSDMAFDGFIETAIKICIYRHPTRPDQGPLRMLTPFRHTHTFSRQIDRSNRANALPVGIVVIYNTLILARGRLYSIRPTPCQWFKRKLFTG